MAGQQRKKPQESTASKVLGGIGDIAGGIGAAFGLDGIGGALSGIGNGFGGAGKEATANETNPFGFMGGVSNALSGILSIPGVSQADDILPSVFGGMGNVFGMITGTQDALNSEKSGADRVVGGLDAAGNAASLYGTMGGVSLTGAGVGGASTLLSSGAGAALTAGGATTAAAGGAVLAAGVGGYKIGTVLNDVATSDSARHSIFGQDSGGRDRTPTDAWIDTMVDLNLGADEMGNDANGWLTDRGWDTTGDVVEGVMDYGGGFVGGVGATVGSIGSTAVGLGTAAFNGIGSLFD